jgi:hypothetical protein
VLSIQVKDSQSGVIIADAQTTCATDKAASSAALVAVLNAQLPANSVLAAVGTSDVITLTAEVAGFEFDAFDGGSDAALASTVTYTTGPSNSTSVIRALAGVSMFSYNVETSSITDLSATYPGGDVMDVMTDGEIWVENSESITQYADVYLDIGATNYGKFYAAASAATRIRLPRSIAHWDRSGDSGFAVLNIHLNR